MSLSPTDTAWAAGFFDGEGCFCVQTAKYFRKRDNRIVTRKFLRVTVTQKDPELLYQFQRIFDGVGSINRNRREDDPHVGHVFSARSRKAFDIAVALWPYISERKKSDFKRVLRKCLENRSANVS